PPSPSSNARNSALRRGSDWQGEPSQVLYNFQTYGRLTHVIMSVSRGGSNDEGSNAGSADDQEELRPGEISVVATLRVYSAPNGGPSGRRYPCLESFVEACGPCPYFTF